MASLASVRISPSPSSVAPAAPDPARTADIEQKQQRVAELLDQQQLDALLLQQPENIAWFTSGGDCSRCGMQETSAALFLTREARVVVANNVDSGLLFDRELPELGFQLKERPWHESRQALLADLCRGRTVGSDSGCGDTRHVAAEVARLRVPLTPLECERLRELGRIVSHAVEATARQCRYGQTETELAGEVAHRLLKRQVVPGRIQVAADGRTERYRHWTFGDDSVQNYCTISAVGCAHGLHVGVARTFCFGDPPAELLTAHRRLMLVHAAGLHFSQSGWPIGEVWKRIERIYEKAGHPDEWRQAGQADVLGYAVSEQAFAPRGTWSLKAGAAVYWHPSIGPALAGDTILIGEEESERLTPMEQWPKLTVEVKGTPVVCPDVLVRPLPHRRPTAETASNGDSVLAVRFEEAEPEEDDESVLS